MSQLETEGYAVYPHVFGNIFSLHHSIGAITKTILPLEEPWRMETIDQAWFRLARASRAKAALLYTALKYDADIRALAANAFFHHTCQSILHSDNFAIVDFNFRIDAPGEEKYLFQWHQDYWFSESSTDAIVAWIPLTNLDDELGGIELLPYSQVGRGLKQARRGDYGNSYADSIVLDEEVDASNPVRLTNLKAGDCLFFKFDVLHRSVGNYTTDRCRWTLLIRMVGFNDPQFLAKSFRPGSVSPNFISYFDQK